YGCDRKSSQPLQKLFAYIQNRPKILRRDANPFREHSLDSENRKANADAPGRQHTTSRRETRRETAAKWLDNQAANRVLTRKPQYLGSTVLRQLSRSSNSAQNSGLHSK